MIRKFFKDDVFAEAFSMTYVKSIHQYFQFIDQRNQLVEAWYKEVSYCVSSSKDVLGLV